MQLPDGERHLLTIDRVAERDCKMCESTGIVFEDGQDVEGECWKCHGTGRRKVRVRGIIPVEAESEWESKDIEYEVETDDFYCLGYEGAIRDTIVKMFLAGTLPPELAANITEEVCDDR